MGAYLSGDLGVADTLPGEEQDPGAVALAVPVVLREIRQVGAFGIGEGDGVLLGT